ncbi:MAG TPA: alpha/beta hydrolase [Synergistaceae bacterium]|nr:alpha/beta hydrolase [Synergistaceae bacterium]
MLLRALLVIVMLLQGSVAFASEMNVQTVPLERNNVKLHLLNIQQKDSNAGKPLLMVHGLTYSSHEFDVNYGDYSLARFFASQGYSVWLLDIAGYGSSQQVDDGFMPNSDYAAEDIAAAARLILEKSGQKTLDVLGWSWGTVTSGRFAAKYPEMVRKLVLYAPIVAGLGAFDVTVAYNHNTWEHAAGDFQVKEDKTIDNEITEQPVVDTFQSNCWRYDGESSPNGGRRDLLVDGAKRLIPTASIKAPTLIIVGDKDPYVSVALCEEAKGTLTAEGSQLKVIPGAGHAMMMEKPYYKEFRQTILDFLK